MTAKLVQSYSSSSGSSSVVSSDQLPPVIHAIAGSIGSALAMLAFYPLERIRVELAQTSVGNIGSREPRSRRDGDHHHRPRPHETFTQCLLRLHEEGSLYKGSSHVLTTLTISNAIFFYALNLFKKRLAPMHHQQQGGRYHHHNAQRLLTYFLSKTGHSLLASIVAGCINVIMTNPLWVASLRIMESKPNETNNDGLHRQNLWNVMYKIVQTEGILSLWNGTSTSLLLVSNPIIQHYMYEQLRAWMLGRRRELARLRRAGGRSVNIQKAASLPLFEAFLFGALAKTVATVVTYPLQLAQVLIRLQKKQQPLSNTTDGGQNDANNNSSSSGEMSSYYAGTLACLHQQFSSGGIPALFQGMNSKLLQTVLTAAFTFLTYEQTLILVGQIYKRQKSI
ncbi:hypothetical protein ACHAWU_008109 [Discostella pseudostelligera]|uniref:Peroxisomal membrane protein PMP34 n=1 Tax=Discostella pseudostelligera TaxID=259834 RepID=A0ABD3MRS7_9STRA